MLENSAPTAHVDTFARDRLPPRDLWPRMDYASVPELNVYPPRINAAVELLRDAFSEMAAIYFGDEVWRYADLKDRADRIARVLVEDFGLLPGERVLLRGPNNPMLVACWLAVLKAGGICVTTMPMLRARELAYIIDRSKTRIALCDIAVRDDLEGARGETSAIEHLALFSALGAAENPDAGLDDAMAGKPADFANVDTAADDIAIIAFTSGTTGNAKGTMHFHRDLLASADTFARKVLAIGPEDIFCATPPLAFTFGLGALVLFPLRFGASAVLVERFAADTMLQIIQRYRCTGIYTAPTAYRGMLDHVRDYDISSLTLCVSAGEHLTKATWAAWHDATGLGIVDGIGATEMLHIFISAAPGVEMRPGSTGTAVPGYEARIVDEAGAPVPPGTEGRLAVRGPTGCRYFDDEKRQRAYVQEGWNLTGDVFRQDEDGHFWYVARADDMIISAGYNISGPEVENAVSEHPAVRECAVVGAPDETRGQVVKAYIVPEAPARPDEALAKDIQRFVRRNIAPYKYPRVIEFVDALPRTPTGKLQRYKLRERQS
jgi:2-aminobenzoate-CoA ligase